VANLTALKPVLAALDDAGDDLPKSLQLLLTYPFSDRVLQGVKGDYTNLWITAQLDARELVAAGTGPRGLLPGTGLPSLPKIPGLNQLPGSPQLPDLSTLPVPRLPGVPTVTCTVLGQRVTVPGQTCPKAIQPGDLTTACSYDRLPTLQLPFVGSRCPSGWSKVGPSGGAPGGLPDLLLGGIG
jgi:phospholipid/cholesterol/gamma-HCH transport system substrate-binding protein